MSSGQKIQVTELGAIGLAVDGRRGQRSSFSGAVESMAYAGLLLFCLVHFLQPGDWIPGAVDLALGKTTAAIALMAFAASVIPAPGQLLGLPRPVTWVALLWLQCAIAGFLALHQNSAGEVGEFLKVVLILIVMVVVSNTFSRLRLILSVQVVSSVVFGLATLRGYSGDRAKGAVHLFGNPNDLALALVITIPLCAYLLLSAKRLMMKGVWLAAILLMSYCVMITYSRGGFLAMMVAYGVMAIGFGFREGRRAFLLVPVVVAVLLFAIAPARYARRLASITHSNMDDGSYAARQQLLARSISITEQHPIIGIGPGNFILSTRDEHVTHNSYTQLSAEAGIPALVLFILVFWATFKALRKQRQSRRQSVRLLAIGLTASIAAALVGCVFASYAYDFTLYYLVAYASCLERCAHEGSLERRRARPSAVRGILPGYPHATRTTGVSPVASR